MNTCASKQGLRLDGTVKEYVYRFAELIDQLASYKTTADALYYVTRVIDGLHDDIELKFLFNAPKHQILGILLHCCRKKLLMPGANGSHTVVIWRHPPNSPSNLPTHYLRHRTKLRRGWNLRVQLHRILRLLMTNFILFDNIGISRAM
jgi:hypothetical protein